MASYTMEQIEGAWSAYKDGQALEILKNGKKEYQLWTPGIRYRQPEGATRITVVALSKAMTFPEYLKTWKQ